MLTEIQLNEEQQRIEQLQQRWMVGSNTPLTLNDLPASWQPLCGNIPPERLPVIALTLASQHQQILLQHSDQVSLKPCPPLPMLPLPVLPEPLRAVFRQALETIHKRTQLGHSVLLHLLCQRGFVAHPADWLLSETDNELPEIYLPWQQWIDQGTVNEAQTEVVLNEDNWDEWYPAQRLQLLKQLRKKDAHGARTLLQCCVMREPADKRLKLLEILTINLQDDDVPFLQTLTQDRSGKVALLATQLLARLGHHSVENQNDQTITQELVETFELKKVGLIKKRLQLSAKAISNKTRQAIRTEQLEKVVLTDFATALGITLEQLLNSWQFDKHRASDNQALVTNAVNTLPDQLLDLLLENLLSYISAQQEELWLLKLLIPRLSQQQRAGIIQALMKLRNVQLEFHSCLAFLTEPLTALSWSMLTTTTAWKKLQQAITEQLAENRYISTPYIDRELVALGLMLSAELAAQALQHFCQAGVMKADPVLDTLKLNAELRTHP